MSAQKRIDSAFARLLAIASPHSARDRRFKELALAGRATIGTGSYVTPTVITFDRDDRTSLHIGAYTSIGPDVKILLGGNHPLDRVSTYPFRLRLALTGAGSDGFPSSKGDIVVGNDVWIGAGTTILSGTHIGDGAVIGANSTVSRDVPSYSIAAGVPARTVRQRFPDEWVERLAGIRWWDWPADVVHRNVDLLSGEMSTEALDRLEEIARRSGTWA